MNKKNRMIGISIFLFLLFLSLGIWELWNQSNRYVNLEKKQANFEKINSYFNSIYEIQKFRIEASIHSQKISSIRRKNFYAFLENVVFKELSSKKSKAYIKKYEKLKRSKSFKGAQRDNYYTALIDLLFAKSRKLIFSESFNANEINRLNKIDSYLHARENLSLFNIKLIKTLRNASSFSKKRANQLLALKFNFETYIHNRIDQKNHHWRYILTQFYRFIDQRKASGFPNSPFELEEVFQKLFRQLDTKNFNPQILNFSSKKEFNKNKNKLIVFSSFFGIAIMFWASLFFIFSSLSKGNKRMKIENDEGDIVNFETVNDSQKVAANYFNEHFKTILNLQKECEAALLSFTSMEKSLDKSKVMYFNASLQASSATSNIDELNERSQEFSENSSLFEKSALSLSRLVKNISKAAESLKNTTNESARLYQMKIAKENQNAVNEDLDLDRILKSKVKPEGRRVKTSQVKLS